MNKFRKIQANNTHTYFYYGNRLKAELIFYPKEKAYGVKLYITKDKLYKNLLLFDYTKGAKSIEYLKNKANSIISNYERICSY